MRRAEGEMRASRRRGGVLGNGACGLMSVDTRCGGTGLAAPFPYIRGGGHSLCYQNSAGLVISSPLPGRKLKTCAGRLIPWFLMRLLSYCHGVEFYCT